MAILLEKNKSDETVEVLDRSRKLTLQNQTKADADRENYTERFKGVSQH